MTGLMRIKNVFVTEIALAQIANKTHQCGGESHGLVQCFSTFFPSRNPFGKRKCLRNPYVAKKNLAEPLHRKNLLKQSLLEANIA
jgi:hypothetical protein